MAMVSYPRRLADLAAADPDAPAVSCGDDTLSRDELDRESTRLAHDLAARGVGAGDFVTIALPNSVDWFVAYVACWKLGAVPQPVSSRLPIRELAAIVELASPKVVVGLDPGVIEGVDSLPIGYRPPDGTSTEPFPDVISRRGRRRRPVARPGDRS